MERLCNRQEWESAAVYEVIGEPAIVINGVPHLTPGCTTPINEEAIGDAEADCDPCLGEWLEGRKVQKMFKNQLYSGKVVKYDGKTNWYRVVYEDGDQEDLEWHELEEVLLPLDISVPLIALALQRCKSERLVSESGLHTAKTNRSHAKSIGSIEKTPKLLQAPCLVESRVGKLTDAKYNRERICQVTWERQKEITRTALQMVKREASGSRLGGNTTYQYQDIEGMTKALVLFQRARTAEIKDEGLTQANLSRGAIGQEISKRPREIQKQSWRTARAEKQKRRKKPQV